MRSVLIVVRADVAPAVRSAIATTLGFDVSDWLSAVPLRRSADAEGTVSHYAAHGQITGALWADLFNILNNETQGIRDATDWQGKPTTPASEARWAVATDGGDIVAAYRMSVALDGSAIEDPTDALTSAGLVMTAHDGV